MLPALSPTTSLLTRQADRLFSLSPPLAACSLCKDSTDCTECIPEMASTARAAAYRPRLAAAEALVPSWGWTDLLQVGNDLAGLADQQLHSLGGRPLLLLR